MEKDNFKPEMKQYSVVLLGEFNPAMFSPEWFGKNKIIAPEDVEFAKRAGSNSIVSPAITIFSTQQLNVKIDNVRFQIATNKEPITVLKDFIKKTFDDLANFTIKAYGLNYSAHYKVDSYSDYHRVGDLLAPKKYWKFLLNEDMSGDDRHGGLASIHMVEEKDGGATSISLQPSNTFKPGFFISCNDHNNLPEEDATADRLLECINNEFETTFEKMKDMQLNLLNGVLGEK